MRRRVDAPAPAEAEHLQAGEQEDRDGSHPEVHRVDAGFRDQPYADGRQLQHAGPPCRDRVGGRHDLALEALQAAARLDQRRLSDCLAAGAVQVMAQRVREAIRAFERAVEAGEERLGGAVRDSPGQGGRCDRSFRRS